MSDAPPLPSDSPASLVRIEAAALFELAARLDGQQGLLFERTVDLVAPAIRAGHKVVLTGAGKSGLVARKIAATLVSTGTPAVFLHPTDALHGDLGLLLKNDIVLALSYSGETEEVLRLIPVFRRIGVALLSFTGCLTSPLAHASVVALDVSVGREACNHDLAPTASTTAMMALGDALAIELSRRLDFQPRDFADLHPGGQLGRKLTTVHRLMHTGASIPVVPLSAPMPQIIHEMSAKRLGLTLVATGRTLHGVLSDGDLRRLLERNGPHAFHKSAQQIMNGHPRTIGPEIFATDALAIMEQHKITALVVTENGTAASPILGVVHLHDLWQVAPAPAEAQVDTSDPDPTQAAATS